MHGKKLTEEDVVGLEVGRLLVLGLAARRGTVPYCWCQCSCGQMLEVMWASLQQRKTLSCGCLRVDTSRAAFRTHGVTSDGTEDEQRAFVVWVGMRARCRNPKNPRYHVYGARGIKIDSAWEEFSQFLADMGPCPRGYSIEREENNGDYTKSNCHWMPRERQAMNRQDTIRIQYLQQEWCFKRLCEYLEKPYLKTYKRYVMRGWSLARALDLTEENTHDLMRLE